MRLLPRQLLLTASLVLATLSGAHAQSRNTVELPVWNQASGKVEAVLLLEPTSDAAVGLRQRFSAGTLDATFGIGAGNSLGLLCDRKTGIASAAIGNLANHCMLASLGDKNDAGSHRFSAGTAFSRGGNKFGLNLGTGQDTLPYWLSPTGKNSKAEQNDLTLFGEKNLGREGFVTIGGTVAKARLVATDDPALSDRWNIKSLSIGGGFGAFSGNIVGRVIDVPGQSNQWKGLGLGLTWRTPWSGQLTVGADNVVTRGKNPFAPANADSNDQGTVPYVRYEQDL